MGSRRRNNQFGYSLLEITIVLSLLSAFLLVSLLPVRAALERQQAALFVQQFAFDLNYAASEARAKQATVRLDIFREDRSYRITVDNRPQKQVKAPPGMRIRSNFPNERLRFYPDGQVSRAGTIELLNDAGEGFLIVVQLSSGRFHVRSVGP